MRAAIVAAASLLLLLGPGFSSPARAGLGLDVSPVKLEIAIPPGTDQNLPVTVRNAGDSTVHVVATLYDFDVSPSGDYGFKHPGTLRHSLMQWARINPREFDIPASTMQQVQLTLEIPKDQSLDGEYAGMIFFQTRPPRGSHQQLTFSARIGSKIYSSIPGTVRIAGEVTSVDARRASGGENYRVLFKNEGTRTSTRRRGSRYATRAQWSIRSKFRAMRWSNATACA